MKSTGPSLYGSNVIQWATANDFRAAMAWSACVLTAIARARDWVPIWIQVRHARGCAAVLTRHQNCCDLNTRNAATGVGRSNLIAVPRRFQTQHTCYVAASTHEGRAGHDPPHSSHVAARQDPEGLLVQSCVPDRGPLSRLYSTVFFPSTFTCERRFTNLVHVNVLGPNRPHPGKWARSWP